VVLRSLIIASLLVGSWGWPAGWSPEGKAILAEQYGTVVSSDNEPQNWRKRFYSDGWETWEMEDGDKWRPIGLDPNIFDMCQLIWADHGLLIDGFRLRPKNEWGAQDWQLTQVYEEECKNVGPIGEIS